MTKHPLDARLGAIRRSLFSSDHPLDEGLSELSRGEASHGFLENPAGQLPYVYLTRLVKEVIAKRLGKGPGETRILDWGCGKGHVTYLLKRLGEDVTSCDVKSNSGDSAFHQKTPIIDKSGIDVIPLTHEYRLPFPDASFDAVVGFGVLEHVPNERKSLLELNRILRPDGLYFYFFLPYTYSWTQRLSHMRGDYYHDRLYSRSQVEEMTRSSGFALLDIWHRAILPKNSVRYPGYTLFERLDNLLCRWTPLRHLATNIEFVAAKARELPVENALQHGQGAA